MSTEKIIADYLYRNGVRYEYEHSAKTNAWIFSKKISRPDFYLPDHDVYVEYWGLVDADSKRTRSKYSREIRWKMARYHKHGIKFISIYPSNLEGLDWVFRAKFKDVTGISLPSKSS